MKQNPQLAQILTSVYTPEELTQIFGDVGFNQGDQNPPQPQPPQQPPYPYPAQQQMGAMPMMAQGGLVDLPGYYQEGGRAPPMRVLRESRPPLAGLQRDLGYFDVPSGGVARRGAVDATRTPVSPEEAAAQRYPAPGYVPNVNPAGWDAAYERWPESTNVERRYAVGGLTLPAMSALSREAHFSAPNLRNAIPKAAAMPKPPGVHLINSSVPGRTDRIPMQARTGSYVIPADAVSGMGQGNTMAGAKMWGALISHSIGPMGIANTIKQRSLKAPSLRMPSPKVKFAEGGDTEYTPIITAGGEIVVDPEIVHALGDGDPEAGKKMLASSVMEARKHTVRELKKLPRPIA